MSKTITLRISEDHYEAFKKYAQMDNRKISNAIETLALKQLENAQFADALEMEGILADADLVSRIERGVRRAKAGKGRFVE
jgi:hypothetical protein